MQMVKQIVEMKNISKIYKSGRIKTPALKKINLKIFKGEFIAIIGPSGSGKSTLLNILGLLDKPTTGKYLFEGEDVFFKKDAELSKIRNQKIGFVFQSYNLLPRYSVFKNVELPLSYSFMKNHQGKEQIQNILKKVDLIHKISNKPSQLSGGEQQRVAIARALIMNPLLLLADEPTGNLDTKTSQRIMEIFNSLNKELKLTIILVTHEKEIADYAQRIIYLKDGQIIKNER